MKKLIAMTLAVLLVCSLSITAFAAWHPSIDAECEHELLKVTMKAKKADGTEVEKELDVSKLEEGALRVVDAKEAKAVNDALPADTSSDEKTDTGLTYGQNADLVHQLERTYGLGSVPGYIRAHVLGKEGAKKPLEIAEDELKMNEQTLHQYDFVHVYALMADYAKLKEIAGLDADDKIESLGLTLECMHMNENTVIAFEQDLFKAGEFIDIKVEDGKTSINVEDVAFAKGTASDETYSIEVAVNEDAGLSQTSVITHIAKAAG